MLSREELETLYRNHREEQVLSIYLDADQHDFAQRAKWRVALKNRLSDQRSQADEPELLDRAYEHLEASLPSSKSSFLPGRGWVGFATPEARLYAENLPVTMPNLVRWEKGLRVAPYARALGAGRPVVAVVVDSRRARLLRYGDGDVTEGPELQADTYLGDLTDVHVPKRAAAHSGIRGKTGTDAANRYLEVERDRLFTRVAEEVRAEAGDDGMVVIGGVARAIEALGKELGLPAERVSRDPGLEVDSPADQVRTAAERARVELSQHLEGRLVERLVDRAHSGGTACLGTEETHRALRERRADTLLVSRRLRDDEPDEVDRAEGSAFDQRASVIEVSGDAGERLDREGGGIGALLRYQLDRPEADRD
ncbi:MAG: hypothetical protein PVH96_07780 [Gemmatimonadota bacterium]|jgi:hypothetical protein